MHPPGFGYFAHLCRKPFHHDRHIPLHPHLDDLKRNYLFFDQLQTSESFLNTNLQILQSQPQSQATLSQIDDIKREFDFMADKGIISPKEDIERRLLDRIGDFDLRRIHRILGKTPPPTPLRQPIMDFFGRLITLYHEFGLEIIGNRFTLGINLVKTDLDIFNDMYTRMEAAGSGMLAYVNTYSSLYSRFASIALNEYFDEQQYFPLIAGPAILDPLRNSNNFWPGLSSLRERAVNLVIDKFPIPDPTVSWEQLIDFRNDPDSREKILALRVWIADTAKKETNLSDLNEKLELALVQYTNQFKKYKVKYRLSQFETVLLPTLQILENLVKLNFSKVAQTFFELHRGQFTLMESERKFAGREVAYIHKVQDFLHP